MTDVITVPSEAKKRGRPPKEAKEEISVITADKPVDKEYSVEIIRDYYGNIDPFYFKGNPKYVYRFLRDEHKNLSIKTSNLLFQKGGWQIAQKEHLLKCGIKERELSPDGFLRRGDTILAFITKELYAEKEKYRIEKANEPMKMINRKLVKGEPSIGGKEIHESMKGIQTQDELKGNWK